jgi:hypothetical protein
MKRRLILAASIAGAVGLWAGWELQTFFAIDGCLDAGGRWDYQTLLANFRVGWERVGAIPRT